MLLLVHHFLHCRACWSHCRNPGRIYWTWQVWTTAWFKASLQPCFHTYAQPPWQQACTPHSLWWPCPPRSSCTWHQISARIPARAGPSCHPHQTPWDFLLHQTQQHWHSHSGPAGPVEMCLSWTVYTVFPMMDQTLPSCAAICHSAAWPWGISCFLSTWKFPSVSMRDTSAHCSSLCKEVVRLS